MKEGLESKVSFSSFDNICKVCPLDYADDLKFWGINESFMEFCCQVPNQTVEVNDIKICDIGRIEKHFSACRISSCHDARQLWGRWQKITKWQKKRRSANQLPES